ncbi:ferric siderophore ABC transporter substrate-binding protein, partial [Pyxidicoccus sp. 3LG]
MPLPEQPSVTDIVLGARSPKRSGTVAWAVLATVTLHGAAGVLAWRAWKDGARRPVVAVPQPTMKVDHVVDLSPPPPPAPPPPAPPPSEPPRAARSEPAP